MSVTAGLLDGIDILDFLDWMCVRREKMYWSVEVLGREVATAAYEDVLLVVDAVKTVLRRELALPAPAA